MSTNMTLIETKTIGAGGSATIELTSIPQTYTDLQVLFSGRSNASGRVGVAVNISFNGSTSNRSSKTLYASNGTPGSDNFTTNIWTQDGATAASATSNTFSNYSLYIPNYTSSNYKSLSVDSVPENNGSTLTLGFTAGLWSSTAAITSITLTPEFGSFVEGSSISLYGISAVTSSPSATGGIISQDATYWYHTFPFTSTFTPLQSLSNVDYLVIAGGGGGGGNGGNYGGGGGAGGLRCTVDATGGGGSLESKLSLTAQTYTVTVGAGGAGTSVPTSGSNSVFSTITSNGGGSGSSSPNGSTAVAASGGSGGGGDGYTSTSGASGATNQGRAGGNGYIPGSGSRAGGGGGGANVAGTNAGPAQGGKGGDGVSIPTMANSTFTGFNTYFAGGGGGSSQTGSSTTGNPGLGGLGGGGNGTVDATAQSGLANTGSGGGGSGYNNNTNTAGITGNGGSGLVIIRYAK
jgi:hypothetical protein